MNRRELMSLAVPLMAAAYFAPSLAFSQEAAPQQAARDPYAPTEVAIRNDFEVGSIVVVSKDFFLYHVIAPGRAVRYGVAVGTDELVWKGRATVGRKVEWPSWTPPSDMLRRRPDLPRHMAGGIENPLGARAMYLGSTLYRIHGSNEPETIGQAVSSGCFRMTNEDVKDLYDRVSVGATVVVKN